MRKQDLYDFIEVKLAKTKRELNVQINDILKVVKEAAKKEFVGLENITRYLVNASDSMEKVLLDHKEIMNNNWYTTNTLSHCNSAIRFQDNAVDRLCDIARFNLDGSHSNSVILDSKYPRLFTVLNEHRKMYESLKKKIENVDKLEKELNGVIKGSRSGKDAYKSLVALNVNMSGFEDSKATLPAVQKLSVDVCLINGDCD